MKTFFRFYQSNNYYDTTTLPNDESVCNIDTVDLYVLVELDRMIEEGGGESGYRVVS